MYGFLTDETQELLSDKLNPQLFPGYDIPEEDLEPKSYNTFALDPRLLYRKTKKNGQDLPCFTPTITDWEPILISISIKSPAV